jgi:ABC-type proline/glycine betaine transport system ATPase subunit
VAQSSSSGDSDVVVEISDVWKIFGDNAAAALEAIKSQGLGKAEVLARYNAVVGVADVSLSVNRGEIFCIMGLSGSGKSTLVRHFNRLLEPTAGKIMIEGTDVMALGPKELQTLPQPQDRHGVPELRADAAPLGAGQCRHAAGGPARSARTTG